MIPKSHIFPLQKVLEYRQYLEDLRAVELGKIQAEEFSANKRLSDLKSDKTEALDNVTKEIKENRRINLNDLKLQNDYLEDLHHKIEHQNKTVQQLKSEVEKNRQQLQEAVKERKMVEKLKDQFKERKKHHLDRIENQRIDEIAIRMQTINGNQGA
ncbi:MAG: flagellar export protein FliJ [Calditrichaeota bacterium]|nr:flagellar export protein FliJ [Calditrichota bacterium]